MFLFPTWRGVRLYEGLLVRLPSLENNNRCGFVEGWLGKQWEYGGAVKPARQHSRAREGGSTQSRRRLFERLEQEEQRLKKHDGRWMDIQQSVLVRQPFFRKASNLWKTAYNPSAIISNNLQPIC